MKKILIIFLSLLCFGCFGSNGVKKSDAILVMDNFYEDVKKGEFSLVKDYYSEAFYNETSESDWKDLFTKIHKALGSFKSTELEEWQVKVSANTSGSGTFFIFTYHSIYENGSAVETITLFSPRGSDEIKINGHYYNSDIFVQ